MERKEGIICRHIIVTTSKLNPNSGRIAGNK
jgi:hypothetical protein